MSRPRRAAAVSRKKIEQLDLSEESDDGDFSSGDSDDYDPSQTKTKDSESEPDDESDSELDESAEAETSNASPVKPSRYVKFYSNYSANIHCSLRIWSF